MQKQDFLGSLDIQNHMFAYKTNGILIISFSFFIFFIIMGEDGEVTNKRGRSPTALCVFKHVQFLKHVSLFILWVLMVLAFARLSVRENWRFTRFRSRSVEHRSHIYIYIERERCIFYIICFLSLSLSILIHIIGGSLVCKLSVIFASVCGVHFLLLRKSSRELLAFMLLKRYVSRGS